MKKNNIEITEENLHAYVDGQLSREKVEAVQDLMLKNPAIEKQIKEWQQQNKLIQEHFSSDLFDKVPERLNPQKIAEQQIKEASVSKPWYLSLVASLLMMTASGSLGWFLSDYSQPNKEAPNFASSAISAYEVFSVEVLHPVEVSADKKDHLVAWLSKRLDHPLKIPELNQYGYKLLGGRLLPMQEGKPAAQLMFENNEGKRVTWLVSKNSSYKDKSFLFKKDNDVNSYYWMDSNIAYSISGEIDRKDLLVLSEKIYKQINEDSVKQVAGL